MTVHVYSCPSSSSQVKSDSEEEGDQLAVVPSPLRGKKGVEGYLVRLASQVNSQASVKVAVEVVFIHAIMPFPHEITQVQTYTLCVLLSNFLCVHVHVHVHLSIVCVCHCVYVYTHVHACMCVCLSVCMHAHIHVCIIETHETRQGNTTPTETTHFPLIKGKCVHFPPLPILGMWGSLQLLLCM